MSFATRFAAARAAYGPLCVGIDPHPELLEAWGLEDDFEGLRIFAETCAEAFAGKVGFVKPQSAFFERFGSVGIAVLETLIENLRHTGSLVILDIKRGDIGSTSKAYASAYLDDDAPLAVDAVTVSPYLGTGALDDFHREAQRNDAGVFTLAMTSNPDGRELQAAITATGLTVAQTVLADAAKRNSAQEPFGSAGAVIGAQAPFAPDDLDFAGPILVPGYGAQGGTAEEIRHRFASAWDRVTVSASRSVLSAGRDVLALGDAASRAQEDLVGS